MGIASSCSCCGWCDYVGCVDKGCGRSLLAHLDMVILVLALVAAAIGCIGGLSSSMDVVTGIGAWSSLEGPNVTVYANLWGVVAKAKGGSCEQVMWVCGRFQCVLVQVSFLCVGQSWEDLESSYSNGTAMTIGNYSIGANAEDCKNASSGVRISSILSVVLSFVAIVTRSMCNWRGNRETDKRKKCVVLFSTLLPVITNAAAALQYPLGCVKKFNDQIDEAEGTPYAALFGGAHADLEIGFYLFSLSFACFLTSFVINFILAGNTDSEAESEPKMKFPPA